jgi:glutamate--cysteine ligase
LSSGDPVQGYLDFALGAVPFLLDDVRDIPLGTVIERRDLMPAEWEAHLSTLFPEIRPRGYLEVRSIDAQAPEWYAAPIAFLAGIVYDRTSLDAALDVLEEPTDDLLARAGARGLQDPDIADLAAGLFELGLAGCRRLGTDFLAADDYESAQAFFEEYTRRGRCPADDTQERF